MDFGPFLIVVFLLLLPVAILMFGALGAWLFGALVEDRVYDKHRGSELDELWG